MGRNARLREAGVKTGCGVGTPNPTANTLMQLQWDDSNYNRNIKFSDRRYHVDRKGTFHRLKVPVPPSKDEHG